MLHLLLINDFEITDWTNCSWISYLKIIVELVAEKLLVNLLQN